MMNSKAMHKFFEQFNSVLLQDGFNDDARL